MNVKTNNECYGDVFLARERKYKKLFSQFALTLNKVKNIPHEGSEPTYHTFKGEREYAATAAALGLYGRAISCAMGNWVD